MCRRLGACDDRPVATSAPSARPAAPAPEGRPQLTRAVDGRLLAGVCQGLAEHLRVDVLFVRGAFVVLAVTGGTGRAMYAAFWLLAPQADRRPGEREQPSAARAAGIAATVVVAGGAVTASLVLGTGSPGLLLPVAVVAVGVVVLWRELDEAQRTRWRTSTRTDRFVGILRTAVGAVLVVLGSSVVVTQGGGLQRTAQVGLAALVVVAGLALVTGPWWLRTLRELSAERAARIREQERAEVAAHVHDSVLQTLALIQRHHDDPRQVARLARAQERELRGWLYRAPAPDPSSLRVGLERAAAEVEDSHGVTVEVVIVGDCPMDEPMRALLLAAREALVNSAKYAPGAPVAMYAEIAADEVAVYVRDRGPGFDLATVPEDRLGVRQSILGRMERNGGRASVRGAPGGGTEVALELPRRGARADAGAAAQQQVSDGRGTSEGGA